MRDFELIDCNLRHALQFFGQATGSGLLGRAGGVELIYCGLNYGVFNMALLAGAPGSLRDSIEEARAYFAPKAPRWSFWLCEDWLDAATRRRSREEFAGAGLRMIAQPPGMLTDGLAPANGRLPYLDIVPVGDAASREAFGEITGVCFDIPCAVSRAVYAREQAWQGSYKGYVALLAGKPVSAAAACSSPGALGIYSVGTLPDFRRRGYSEALVRCVVERERRGREPIVLQASEAGRPIYRRMGFRDAAKFSVYLTK